MPYVSLTSCLLPLLLLLLCAAHAQAEGLEEAQAFNTSATEHEAGAAAFASNRSQKHTLDADFYPHAVPSHEGDELPQLPKTAELPLPEGHVCDAEEGIMPCYVSGCFLDCLTEVCLSFALLAVVCMGAHTFGTLLANVGFPAITTFILFGMLCGPFFLGVMHSAQLEDLQFINQLALGFIGMSAGGKLHVKDVKQNLSATLCVLGGVTCVTYAVSIVSTLLLGSYFLPFVAHLDFPSRLAVSLLIACLAVARSPSSAIAIIEELHAKGPFTTTVLTVTVFMDVVVVLLFALTQLLVDALVANPESGESASAAAVLSMFAGQTLISIVFGVGLGKLFSFLMFLLALCAPLDRPSSPRGALHAVCASAFVLLLRLIISLIERALFLVSGWLLFVEEEADQEAGRWQWQNPLIVCMVSGFTIANFTHASDAFSAAMHDVAGPLYLLFFAYTGLTMDLLSLSRNWLACILLFGSRCAGIVVGSRLGGIVGGQPPEYYKRYWMAFLTQAGVALGLAQGLPESYFWKPDFVATSVALVVCNQMVGPPLFKLVIKLVKEDNHGYHPQHDVAAELTTINRIALLGKTKAVNYQLPRPRGALIIGQGGAVPLSVANRLRRLKWEVVMADSNLDATQEPQPGAEAQRTERQMANHLSRLPLELRDKVKGYHVGKSLRNTYNSLPTMSRSIRVRTPTGSESSMLRTDSFHEKQLKSRESTILQQKTARRLDSFHRLPAVRDRIGEFYAREANDLKARLGHGLEYASMPSEPELPKRIAEAMSHNPDFYARSMRLLWVMASMKNIDVIVVLLPTDAECVQMCELIAEMLPLVKAVRKLELLEMPQVVVSLSSGDLVEDIDLEPPPLVISQPTSLQALVCEILHPTAHWTGQLDDELDFLAVERVPSDRASGGFRRRPSPPVPSGMPPRFASPPSSYKKFPSSFTSPSFCHSAKLSTGSVESDCESVGTMHSITDEGSLFGSGGKKSALPTTSPVKEETRLSDKARWEEIASEGGDSELSNELPASPTT